MENATFWTVIGLSATTAFVHTFTGPDHYLPFIVLAKSRKWSLKRTLGLTFVSGLGHILSAIALAAVFSLLSGYLSENESWANWTEETRGSLAAWLLTILGTIYMIWGIYRLIHHHSHTHPHLHSDGTIHTHPHEEIDEHAHLHGDDDHRLLLVWSLFIIFVLGPCEALLPILAASSTVSRLCLYSSTVLFSLVTILTMLTAVTIGYFGVRFLRLKWLERYSHILAGLMIALCGIGMIFFGL